LFQTLVGGILAIIGAIAGSIITGHFLIKSHKKAEIEKKSVEMFEKVFEDVYAPFLEIVEKVKDENEISMENNQTLQELLYSKRKVIMMCPDYIKRELGYLRDDLEERNHAKAMGRIKTIGDEIAKIIDTISFKV
jgi:hypothetical protein